MKPSKKRNSLYVIGVLLMIFSLYTPIPSYPAVDGPLSASTPVAVTTLEYNSYRTQNEISQPDIGSNRTFWTKNFSIYEYYQIEARLLAIGSHCYIYMENTAVEFLGESVALERGASYRDEFDSTIFPYVVDLAGNPDGFIGDIDGDPRIIILLSTNPVSYYDPINDHVGEHSNLCEMVYVTYTTSYILGVISHEFHHLILFNYDDDETTFIYESLAQFAAKYTGEIIPWDNLTWGVSEFVLHPEDSLIYWTPNTGGVEAEVDYGSAYLFGLYLAEQFGIDFMRNMVVEEKDGAEGLVATLDGMGYNITFDELYLNWITALSIDEPHIGNGQYGFHDANVSIHKVGILSTIPYHVDDLSLRCYGFDVRRFVGNRDFFVVQITFPSFYTVGLSIAYHDTEGWHIQQRIQSGGSLVEIVEGSSIDNSYIMTTYLYGETPSENIDVGLGSSITVDLSVLEEVPESSGLDLIPIGVGIGVLSIAMVIVIWRMKKSKH